MHHTLNPLAVKIIHSLTHPSMPADNPAKDLQAPITLGRKTEKHMSKAKAEQRKLVIPPTEQDAALQQFAKPPGTAQSATKEGNYFEQSVAAPSSNASSPTPRDYPPPLLPLHKAHAHSTTINVSHAVFNMDCLFQQYTDEWGIPYERSAAAIRALRDWLDEEAKLSNGERIHFPIEIRFTDADGIWLSHCQGRKTCFIGLVMYRPYNSNVRYRSLFAKFEMLMRHFAGRPHWAKAHTCGQNELRKLYPHLDDFLKLREKHDPDRVFVNPYVRRHLLGELGADIEARVFKARL